MVAVGQLDAAYVQLEPFGHRRLSFFTPHAGQRRLAGRIVVQQSRPLHAQVRLNPLDHQQIEPAVAIGRRQACRRFDTELLGNGGQLSAIGRMRIDADVSLERFAVADPFGRAG